LFHKIIVLTLKIFITYNLRDLEHLEHLQYIKDLGVTFNSKLKFDHHVNEIVNKSYSVLGLIYRNFKYMLSDTFVMLYKTLVRSHLEEGC